MSAVYERWAALVEEHIARDKSRFLSLFRQYDRNGDGFLTRAEFADGLRASRIPISEEDLDALIDFLDADRNNRIDYNEFAKGLHHHHHRTPRLDVVHRPGQPQQHPAHSLPADPRGYYHEPGPHGTGQQRGLSDNATAPPPPGPSTDVLTSLNRGSLRPDRAHRLYPDQDPVPAPAAGQQRHGDVQEPGHLHPQTMDSSGDTYSELLQASLVPSYSDPCDGLDTTLEQPSFCMTISESSEDCTCGDQAPPNGVAEVGTRAALHSAATAEVAAEKAMRAAAIATKAAETAKKARQPKARAQPARRAPQRDELSARSGRSCDQEYSQGLDRVLAHLRRDLMDEYDKAKQCLGTKCQQELQELENRHAQDTYDLRDEVNRLRELMSTYERSTGQKDQLIANLNDALKKEKGKVSKLKEQMEDMKGKTAEKLDKAKALRALHEATQDEFRRKIEAACQAKAREVNEKLKREYDIRMDELLEELERARAELELWRCRREVFEDNVKQAVMRGVCALNMETMNMFDNPQEEIDECNRRREVREAQPRRSAPHAQGPSVRFSFPEGRGPAGASVPSAQRGRHGPVETSVSSTTTRSVRRGTGPKQAVSVERHS